jgi:hypothetical protein
VVISQAAKQDLMYKHFLQHTGSYAPRQRSLNFSELGWQSRNLDHLDFPFTQQEIHGVILSAPKEKAPGTDGFIGLFFSSCWRILKDDLTNAPHHFHSMNQQGLHLLNQAFVLLIPKRQDAIKVSDFRLISLIHSFAKILSKLLANRLGLELNHLISINQTAFIRKRCIQDKFVFVQQVIKDLYKKKIAALFIKLDISNAFDTVNWPYLLSIMQHLGFR